MNTSWFEDTIPTEFFAAMNQVYKAGIKPYSPEKMEELCRIRAKHDRILVCFTEEVALLGIFPKGEDAYFGFWDGSEDVTKHKPVFNRIEGEAKKLGYKRLVGPMNFNTYHANRLRLENVESWDSFQGEPNNPTYYVSVLKQLGYAPVQTYSSHFIAPETVPLFYAKQDRFLKSLDELPFDRIPITSDFWTENLPAFYRLIQDTFGDNAFYSQVSFEEFCLGYGKEFGEMLCPNTSVLFRDKSTGQWAALSLCLPNYHELNIEPPYTFKEHYPLLKRKTFLVKTVGVHPDFRQRKLSQYLAAYGMMRLSKLYDDAIFCLMRSDNTSNYFTARYEKEVAHYALFGKEL